MSWSCCNNNSNKVFCLYNFSRNANHLLKIIFDQVIFYVLDYKNYTWWLLCLTVLDNTMQRIKIEFLRWKYLPVYCLLFTLWFYCSFCCLKNYKIKCQPAFHRLQLQIITNWLVMKYVLNVIFMGNKFLLGQMINTHQTTGVFKPRICEHCLGEVFIFIYRKVPVFRNENYTFFWFE